MALQIIDCEQGSPEWHEARRGVITASNFSKMMAGGDGRMRRQLLFRLAGEIISGEVAETFKNDHMDRGNEQEADARDFYVLRTKAEPQIVGFVRNDLRTGPVGCSPDSLIGDRGGLEIKTCLPSVLVEYLIKASNTPGWYPPEHTAQVQGNMWLCEREWWDVLCYHPRVPPLMQRVPRDDAYIAGLAAETSRFHADLNAVVEKVRRFGA